MNSLHAQTALDPANHLGGQRCGYEIPLPPTPPIPGLSPQEQVRGLLALSREAELSPELAARIQACALAGIHAHERAPEAITELAEVLGPGLVEQGMDSPGPRDLEELEAQGLEALARLEGR